MEKEKEWHVVPIRFHKKQYDKLQKIKSKGRNIAHVIRELVDKMK